MVRAKDADWMVSVLTRRPDLRRDLPTSSSARSAINKIADMGVKVTYTNSISNLARSPALAYVGGPVARERPGIGMFKITTSA